MNNETKELVVSLIDLEIKKAQDFETIKKLNAAYYDFTRKAHPKYLDSIHSRSVDSILVLTQEQKDYLIEKIYDNFQQKDNFLYKYLTGHDHPDCAPVSLRGMLCTFVLETGTFDEVLGEILYNNGGI